MPGLARRVEIRAGDILVVEANPDSIDTMLGGMGLDYVAVGITALIADGIVGLSAGFSPAAVLTLLIIVTMTLSDVMNNTATAVIAAAQLSRDLFLSRIAKPR